VSTLRISQSATQNIFLSQACVLVLFSLIGQQYAFGDLRTIVEVYEPGICYTTLVREPEFYRVRHSALETNLLPKKLNSLCFPFIFKYFEPLKTIIIWIFCSSCLFWARRFENPIRPLLGDIRVGP
jgi:hypothetical protein